MSFNVPRVLRLLQDCGVGLLQARGALLLVDVVAANPFAPTIPCHRVVGAGGAMTGYSGPGGIARASPRATAASASKSSSVRRIFFCLAIEDFNGNGREFR